MRDSQPASNGYGHSCFTQFTALLFHPLTFRPTVMAIINGGMTHCETIQDVGETTRG